MSILFLFLFAATANIVSIENVVTVIIGALSSFGVTQFIKNWTGLQGFGATLLAVVIAFLVAVVAVAIQMLFSGDFSPESLAGYASAIFMTATLAYQAMTTANK